MKKIIALFSFLSLTLLVSCGGGNGPEDVAQKFAEARAKGDYTTAKTYADATTGQMLDMLDQIMPKEEKEKQKKLDVKIEIISSEVKDSTAVVKFKSTSDKKTSEEQKLDLKKIKGDWKVTTNKEGMPPAPGAAPQGVPAPPAPVKDTAVAPAQ